METKVKLKTNLAFRLLDELSDLRIDLNQINAEGLESLKLKALSEEIGKAMIILSDPNNIEMEDK